MNDHLGSGHHDHQHDEAVIRYMIDYQGFALSHGDRDGVAWTHTIGLHKPETERPEVILVCSAPLIFRVNWLLTAGFEVNGPPSAAALQEESRARGIPAAELYYPKGGRVFSPGRIYRLGADEKVLSCFGVVERSHYQHYLWHAVEHHANEGFPVLQLVLSDLEGRFPWDSRYLPPVWMQQHLLFDPFQYLPLREDANGTLD